MHLFENTQGKKKAGRTTGEVEGGGEVASRNGARGGFGSRRWRADEHARTGRATPGSPLFFLSFSFFLSLSLSFIKMSNGSGKLVGSGD